ncbi:MAG: hypothetical protein IAF58_20915, partial [Leptolyngbya sp.]|nr:hypothetical protein [Candidatus Melainabacteria bacterium]
MLPEQAKQSVSERITVLVDGDAGLAVSCLFAQNGYSVRACTTEKNMLVPTDYEIRTRQASVSNFRGRVPFVSIETDLATVLYESDAVIVASPATEYGALLEKTISHLRHGQTILLTNAPLGAGMQFSAAIKKTGVELHVNIIEMGTLFDCAKVEEKVLLITGIVTDSATGKPVEVILRVTTNETGEEIGTYTSNSSSGKYTVVLNEGKNYDLIFSSPKFGTHYENINLTDVTEYKEIERNVSLIPQSREVVFSITDQDTKKGLNTKIKLTNQDSKEEITL